jgi:hypothetical protein
MIKLRCIMAQNSLGWLNVQSDCRSVQVIRTQRPFTKFLSVSRKQQEEVVADLSTTPKDAQLWQSLGEVRYDAVLKAVKVECF